MIPRLRRVAAAGATALSIALSGCAFAQGAAVRADAPASVTPAPRHAPLRIAFMPDVHFHDVYGDFPQDAFPGLTNPRNGRRATIRTLQAQLTSTRLFNENQFAFLAALDDAVARGVTHVALPGDFSDDGQPVHLRGLVAILDRYAAEHGLVFLAAPGNHDPVRPFDRPGGKRDWLGRDPDTGAVGPRSVYSRGGNADCSVPYAGGHARIGGSHCTEEVRTLGHAGITGLLAGHGFMPRPTDRYFETPYGSSDVAGYRFGTALREADWSRRRHRICGEAAGGAAPGGRRWCREVPDATYLVEPVDGVWLVALDANVYVPAGPDSFTGSGGQGFDAMRVHRPHVIAWLRDVVARGARLGKQVVAFSHFPMGEYYNGASDDIARLLGPEAMQLQRRPSPETTRALAGTGLRLHVGGHMHVNDLARHPAGDGGVLFNVQAPSLAAYVPGYTLMTLHGSGQVELEVVPLMQVPRFDELFDLYRAEYDQAPAPPWDRTLLDARDYGEFTRRVFDQLVRRRLLDDWSCELRELVRSPLSGADLLVLSQLRTRTTLAGLTALPGQGGLAPAFFDCLADGPASAGPVDFDADWRRAEASARALAAESGQRLEAFAQWQALDLATDVLRVANAGDLAFADIPVERASQYAVLAQALRRDGADTGLAMAAGRVRADNTPGDLVRARLGPLMAILRTLAAGAPSRHVRLDLVRGELVDQVERPASRRALLDDGAAD
ncbi:metallophosphoesterase [Luteimonas kalidii]|uniref:Metallophosphoesterase n=1 Tax=Luteimonas kalidii TaxID=3042025 RepID=A0ABT6JNW2_9GAMM|nr:metallophosphoesterase [Luteimonas kalidii]MDH5832369.1 metallophosphoesterase [Luteimonas kalidii]